MVHAPAEAKQQVLSTLNRDGSRRWMQPRLSPGRFWRRRAATAWALIALFVLLPYIQINGKPLVLLDLPRRHFTLFGTTFLPTDTVMLMLLGVSIVLTVFLLTALFGRVWCGWACPQTVYMEFLFRPIERLFEGAPGRRSRLERLAPGVRRALKLGVFAVLSLFLAHVFLSYFVGVDQLAQWVRRSPFEHPTSFLVMAGTSLLIFLDFTWFREQTCVVACPYGRLQSVLLDRKSLIVGYDYGRGEPRGKIAKSADRAAGDCVDCRACVTTCPTGIDIREGLQMECIHCTQCMDACDAIMRKVGRPERLIRYSSQDELAGQGTKMLRTRVILYPLAVIVVVGLLVWQLATKTTADVMILRGIGSPYSVLQTGEVSNSIRVKITNRSDRDQSYSIALRGMDEARIVAPSNPLRVAADATETANVFVITPTGALLGGSVDVRFHVTDGAELDVELPYKLLGPETGGGAP